MNEPRNFAIVESGVVVNMIWVCPDAASDFGAIPVGDIPVGIGWAYVDGQFVAPIEGVVEEAPE
jgi:hypothetical protein